MATGQVNKPALPVFLASVVLTSKLDTAQLCVLDIVGIGTPRALSQDGSLSRFIERKGIRFDRERLSIEIIS